MSDFYGAYSSDLWIQQKCLVHLIRDINDDLRNNPFDQEYKRITENFSMLLRNIVATVDKYGLKKRNLSKHKKEVSQFYREMSRCNYQSELAQKYQKRFEKNRDHLFTFFNYDGMPWNNNNAEHAIKHSDCVTIAFCVIARSPKATVAIFLPTMSEIKIASLRSQ